VLLKAATKSWRRQAQLIPAVLVVQVDVLEQMVDLVFCLGVA
jgi:hypothetical protein